MTLDDLRADLYRRLNYPTSPGSEVTTRLTAFLNQRQRRLVTTPGLRQLREGFGQFASVAGTAEYALPFGVARVLNVRDLTNDRVLTPLAFETYRRVWPDPTNETGTPQGWAPIGIRAVYRRPAGTSVWAASSAAGDTTQTVHSVISRADGLPRGTQQAFTTTLNGTTRVQIGNGLYDDVLSLTLSAACSGAVTFFDASTGGNVLGIINAGRRTSRLFLLALSPTPSAVQTYQVDYEHAVVDLANAWDEPLLPEDFHDLLILGALTDEFFHRDDDARYTLAQREYRQRLAELKAFLYNHRQALVSAPPPELAPLGPWYPRQDY